MQIEILSTLAGGIAGCTIAYVSRRTSSPKTLEEAGGRGAVFPQGIRADRAAISRLTCAAVPLAGALLAALVSWSWTQSGQIVSAACAAAFGAMAAEAALTDLETRTIPVSLLAAMIAIGTCAAGAEPRSALCAIGVGAVLWVASMVGQALLGCEVFALGDTLLMASMAPIALSSVASLEAFLAATVLVCIAALVLIKTRGGKGPSFVPFAPIASLSWLAALAVIG